MFLHIYVDVLDTVLIASHGESYLSQCFAVLTIADDILHMDTQFLTHMDCGDNVEEVEEYCQHMGLCQGLNNIEKIDEPV